MSVKTCLRVFEPNRTGILLFLYPSAIQLWRTDDDIHRLIVEAR